MGQPSHLYRNLGGRKFRDVTKKAGLAVPPAETKTLGRRCSTTTATGSTISISSTTASAIVSSATAATATFEETTAETGAGVLGDHPRAGMGVAVGDPFGDGRDSLCRHQLRRRAEQPLPQRRRRPLRRRRAPPRASPTIGLSFVRWGTHFADFDNDGWPDVYAAGGHLAPRLPRTLGHYKSGGANYVEAGDSAFDQKTVAAPQPRRRTVRRVDGLGRSRPDANGRAGHRRGGPRRRRRARPRRRRHRRAGADLPQRDRRRQGWIAIEPRAGRRRPARSSGPASRSRPAAARRPGLSRLAVLRLGLARPAPLRAGRRRSGDGRGALARTAARQTLPRTSLPGETYRLRPAATLEADSGP